jgi:hypothetical protein
VHYSRRTIAAEILSRFYLYFNNQNNDGPQLDSACQKGLEITLTSVLIVVLSWCTGVKKMSGGIFEP